LQTEECLKVDECRIFGVVLFLPFLGWFATKVVDFAGEPGMAVRWAQLIFKLVMTLAVLILLSIFQRRVELFDSTAAASTISRSGRPNGLISL
jgi:Na+/phosphate symporter